MLTVTLFANADDASVGKLLLAKGVVTAVSISGDSRVVGTRSEVFNGERIITAKSSFVVIRFNDNTKVTLRPESDFTIDQYIDEEDQEVAKFTLLKGGLRTISGVISKRNPNAVNFVTPTATIGIRGTDFAIRVCGQDCRDEEKAYAQFDYIQTSCQETIDDLPDGLYYAVFDGAIYARQQDNYVELKAVGAGHSSQRHHLCLSLVPKFLVHDPFLKVNRFEDETFEIMDQIDLNDDPSSLQCVAPPA